MVEWRTVSKAFVGIGVVTRLTVPDLKREFEQLASDIKEKAAGLTEADVEAEVDAHRAERRRK